MFCDRAMIGRPSNAAAFAWGAKPLRVDVDFEGIACAGDQYAKIRQRIGCGGRGNKTLDSDGLLFECLKIKLAERAFTCSSQGLRWPMSKLNRLRLFVWGGSRLAI
jgi:hypothetical protein